MSNKNSSEELQNRREFFKKAAKAALPVVGAVVLANPLMAQIGGTVNYISSVNPAHAAAMGCSECSGSCLRTCQGNCNSTCQGDCNSTCSGTCEGSGTAGNPNSNCMYGCSNSCSGGCKGSCYRTCYSGCDGDCTGTLSY